MSSDRGFELLKKAVRETLAAVPVNPMPETLWSAEYRQHASSGSETLPVENEHILRFPPPSMDLAFDDEILDNVKEMWQRIAGEGDGEFLVFQDREQYDDDE